MRFSGLLPLLGSFVLLSAPRSLASAKAPAPMDINADVVRMNLDKQTTEASGNARLTYGGITLNADQITADKTTGDVEAAGHLALVEEGRRLEGDRLTYNFVSDKGVLHHAHVREQGVIVTGDTIDFSPQAVVAHHASFTTCDKPNPDYSLDADEITLTAAQAAPGKQPQSGRLTMNHARVTYHGHRLFSLPRYSVTVGDIGRQGTSPFPTGSFDREDGPSAQVSYSLGASQKTTADFSYRYTSFRGIRGYLKLKRDAGPLHLQAGYIRREASTDRELRPDDFTTGLANVLVNREPEFRASLPNLPVFRSLALRTEFVRGSYSETEHFATKSRARADRTEISALLALKPYRITPKLSFSHAIGWREASYSTGTDFSVRFLRHRLEYMPTPSMRVALSYVERHGSGETPFLFDGVDIRSELLSEARYRLNPKWRLRIVNLYDLERHDSRDMILAATRTIHCLDYTVGWRKSRGTVFVGINLTPPAEGLGHDRAGASAPSDRISPFGEY